MSSPSSVIITTDIEIAKQSLTLECSVTTVRGITSRVDIVWSSDGVELKRIKGTNINLNFSSENNVEYAAKFVSPLSTTDDGKVYQCQVVINAIPELTAFSNVTVDVTGTEICFHTYSIYFCVFHFSVPTPTVSITPSGPIQGAMVGNPQDIQCTVSTVSGVELSSVMISWMGPGGDTITNDSRVTISPTSGSGNNYTSSLQFMYLMEGDEGTYECNVMILETMGSEYITISALKGMGMI